MRHVLIIEDDGDIREALSDVLELEGYGVAWAANGAEGLEQARRLHPDLILLDLMMPVMSGWQFRDAQRQDAAIRDVPVVVLSAVRSTPSMDVAAYVSKPCSVAELLAVVHRVEASA